MKALSLAGFSRRNRGVRPSHPGATGDPPTRCSSLPPNRRAWFSGGQARLAALALALAAPANGAFADPGTGTDDQRAGVRFVASLSVPPSSDGATITEYTDLRVDLTISAHAGEVDFYGPVPVALESFSARDGATERTIWSESGCHRDRGLPKVRFRRITGTARVGERMVSIDAAPSEIGFHLPRDEVIVGQSLLAGESSGTRREYALRAHTRASGVKVIVRLCRILCAF